jgi:RHS repeat-associated protein
MLATVEPDKINYHTPDHLGSPRVLTDAFGAVISRRDFLPFGDPLSDSLGNRASIPGYSINDTVKQRFTGYQRDEESGLDFAQARYFSSNQGRFTSVDPLGKSAQIEDPQTWNRYAYVSNNPINLNDPLGLDPGERPRTKSGDQAAAGIGNSRLGEIAEAILKSVANAFIGVQNVEVDTGVINEEKIEPYQPSSSLQDTIMRVTDVGLLFSSLAGKGSLTGVGVAVAEGKGATVNAGKLGQIADPVKTKGPVGTLFTPAGKRKVIEANRLKNDGKVICEDCKIETVPQPGPVRGQPYSPPPNSAQVDHVIPNVEGGQGVPENGQVLCLKCNSDKRHGKGKYKK